MTTYCNLGDTDVFVVYSFGSGEQKTIKIRNAPIRIETQIFVRSVPPSEQIEGQLYNVNYTVTRPNYAETVTGTSVFRGKITGAGVNTSAEVGYSANNNWRYEFYITAQGYGELTYYDVPINIFLSNAFGNPHGEIKINWIAPLNNQESICTIETYYQDRRIYYDEGDCPLSYEVTCKQKCPPGTTKCLSTNYPGYCCLPCEPTKQSIISIKNMVKSINKEPVSYG